MWLLFLLHVLFKFRMLKNNDGFYKTDLIVSEVELFY